MSPPAELALPALVVLAAEPLYVLVDTAVVGHLGRVPLAAVAVGGTVMSVAVWFGTLMAYGTTGRAARRFGAGDRAAAVAEGVQASWPACSRATPRPPMRRPVGCVSPCAAHPACC